MSTEGTQFRSARERMVEALRGRGIDDALVLAAMGRIPRQIFVSEALGLQAYGDHALPLVDGQTLTQPHTVALCVQDVHRAGAQRVLEVGTGSGYQAAVLASVCRHVFSVERHAGLVARARANLDRLGVVNVALLRGDGAIGWSRYAPYEAIVVAAAAPAVPEVLVDQLAPGGRLLVPVGDAAGQELLRVTVGSRGRRMESLGTCSFVPLVSERAAPKGSAPPAAAPPERGSAAETPPRALS